MPRAPALVDRVIPANFERPVLYTTGQGLTFTVHATFTTYPVPDWNMTTGGAVTWSEPWTWVNCTSSTINTRPTRAVASPEAIAADRHRQLLRRAELGFDLPDSDIAQLTDAQRATWEASVANRRLQEQAERELAEARQAERNQANLRAYALLDMVLSQEQRDELANHGHITVNTPAGNRYRLERGYHAGNIAVWDPETERWTGSMCVHVSGRIPDGDNLATQLLMLMNDEGHLLRTGNASGHLPQSVLAVRHPERFRPNAEAERLINEVEVFETDDEDVEIQIELPAGHSVAAVQNAVREIMADTSWAMVG